MSQIFAKTLQPRRCWQWTNCVSFSHFTEHFNGHELLFQAHSMEKRRIKTILNGIDHHWESGTVVEGILLVTTELKQRAETTGCTASGGRNFCLLVSLIFLCHKSCKFYICFKLKTAFLHRQKVVRFYWLEFLHRCQFITMMAAC